MGIKRAAEIQNEQKKEKDRGREGGIRESMCERDIYDDDYRRKGESAATGRQRRGG